MSRVVVLEGCALAVLPNIPEESVQCVVTSPPYWGLRDYGVAGQLGLEATPEEYVAHMAAVFREVWRVLKKDGTCWINLGDSYSSGGRKTRDPGQSKLHPAFTGEDNATTTYRPECGLGPKQLVGIPWRVAFALQADGWYLRQDIIWSKPNPMPESVRDRCTKSHEYLFLLSKSERYHYDAEAIQEPVSGTAHPRRSYKTPDGWDTSKGSGGHGSFHREGREKGQTGYEHKTPGVGPKAAAPGSGIKNNASFSAAVVDLVENRNRRSVWTVPAHPFPEAHFATFPPALVEPCILAGSRPGDTILDPFGGAGTTGLVADRLQRNAILIEINPEYAAMARKRILGDAPLLAEVGA